MPKVARAVVNRILETEEQIIGQQEPRTLKSTGPAKEALQAASVIDVQERPVDKEWAEMIGFSRQIVTIAINASSDKNAEDPIFVSNNGDAPMVNGVPTNWLFRETDYPIERRFVESLARAKITAYSQKDVDAPDGTKHKKMVPHTACRYPFRVIHDPHPCGAEWLKAVLMEKA